jgi:intraflagellar transport protein 140
MLGLHNNGRICIRSSQQFAALQSIVKDIMGQTSVNTDPLLLQKCASFFVENNEIDKALDMLCAAQKV